MKAITTEMFLARELWSTIELNRELQRDRDRLDWMLDNASIRGGGDGFTIKVFVPMDCECVRTGIDLVMEKG
jgi:hypothetical protein